MTTASDFQLNLKIPEGVQDKLKKIMTKFKATGIWGSALEKEYKKISGEELQYGNYGYGSLLHMCTTIDYIFAIVKHPKGDYKLFEPCGSIPQNLNVLPKEDLQLLGDVLQYNDFIPRQKLPVTDKMIPVKASDIYDISKFWFYTLEAEKELWELMSKMNAFYASSEQYYKIPSYQLREKLYCVTIYQGQYHRAVIVDILPSLQHSVKVFFIDFGTVAHVMVTNLYFLHRLFKKPDALAIRAQLAFVKPLGSNMPWQKAATDTFISYVGNQALEAHIEGREENGVYLLKLFDNKLGKKYWIHEQLVQKKVAILNSNKQLESESIPCFAKNKQMMHLMPTFEDLENGIAPNREELNLLNEIGYGMEKIFMTYFKY